MKYRIMYIERRGGEGRIGRITISRTGKTLSYKGRALAPLGRDNLGANYYDVDTHEEYRIVDCRKDGADRLAGEGPPVEIDEDVREEYWTGVRGQPEQVGRRFT
jgi:hypothetical protein